MKVVDVKAYTVDYPVERPYVWRHGLPGSGTIHAATWMHVITDEGIAGWSQMPRGPIALDLVRRYFRDLLIGENPLQKELLWHKVWELDRIEELPLYALGGIDIALWDITAKAAGLPLYQLLGGYRDKLLAYASTVTFATTEEFLEVADQCLASGFRAIKLHAWGDARRDAKLCQELRQHVGNEIALMYDGSAGFTPYEALYVGRACEEAGYYWYEEPLRSSACTPIADSAPTSPSRCWPPKPPMGATTPSRTSSSRAPPTWCARAPTIRAASPAPCAWPISPTPSR